MKLSSIGYSIRQGFKNICRNIRFSLASVATISACIFLFCLFFSIVLNIRFIVRNAETQVAITVFFNEDMDDTSIQAIGTQIEARPEVKEAVYISADEAWNTFKTDYFGDKEYLAEGFADDNPLKGSASYSIYLYDISTQEEFVSWLNSLDGIRQVNYSSAAVAGLSSFNRMIGILSIAIIAVLLAVAMFLISNTISVTAEFRKSENEIMRLIGATNSMIRAPFVIEGTILGLVGAAIPLVAVYFLYNYAVNYIHVKFLILSNIFTFLPVQTVWPYMAVVSLALGVGIGFFVSFFTIRKHLKV